MNSIALLKPEGLVNCPAFSQTAQVMRNLETALGVPGALVELSANAAVTR